MSICIGSIARVSCGKGSRGASLIHLSSRFRISCLFIPHFLSLPDIPKHKPPPFGALTPSAERTRGTGAYSLQTDQRKILLRLLTPPSESKTDGKSGRSHRLQNPRFPHWPHDEHAIKTRTKRKARSRREYEDGIGGPVQAGPKAILKSAKSRLASFRDRRTTTQERSFRESFPRRASLTPQLCEVVARDAGLGESGRTVAPNAAAFQYLSS